jgi:Domain of unknown function (DUF4388)
MSGPFQFQVTLAETSIAEVFWTIYRHKVPGLIEMRREGVEKRIYINDGAVIHAGSSDRTDRLGAFLYRIGKVTRQELADTMQERESTGKRHGQVLIEKGIMAPQDLYDAIRQQMESIVWSVFSWQSGDLSFKIGEFNDPMMIRIHLPMRQVILRGIKKVQDAKALVSRLGRKGSIFRPVYSTEDLIEVSLTKEEYHLLTLIDGKRTLYEVCTTGPFGVSENARLIYAFRVLQLIELFADDESSTGIIKIQLRSE